MSLQASMVLIIIALYYKSAARLTQLANKVKSPFHSAAATILTTTTEMNEESSIVSISSSLYLMHLKTVMLYVVFSEITSAKYANGTD
jgi:hypothetical protein